MVDIINFFSKMYINICCFQLLSHVRLCNPMDCIMPGFPVHNLLTELAQTHDHAIMSFSVIPFSSYLQSFPESGSFPTSQFFTTGGQSIIASGPSNKYSELISFRVDWFDLLAIQGTLKNLLQHFNLRASILQHSAFFMVNSHIHT